MKLPVALVALCLTAGLMRADVVIVQKVDGAGHTGQMTVKVSGDKVRTDISPAVSTITDAGTGDITTLMHTQKSYMVISAAAAKAMLEQMTKVMQQSGAAASGTPAPPVATGKTEKLDGGYTAAEYTFNSGIIKATYWMSSDFPNGKAVAEALAKFRKGSLADMTKAFSPDLSALPGVPVKTEMEISGQKVTTELVSAVEGPIAPTEFQVPATYTKMTMPAMPVHQ